MAGLLVLLSLGLASPVMASPMPETLPGTSAGAAPEGSGVAPQARRALVDQLINEFLGRLGRRRRNGVEVGGVLAHYA
jgi:hypothetical protein